MEALKTRTGAGEGEKKVLQDGRGTRPAAKVIRKGELTLLHHCLKPTSTTVPNEKSSGEKILLGNSGRSRYLAGRNFPGAFEEKHSMKQRERAAEMVGKCSDMTKTN